jgi:hypothetical protein
MQLWDRNLFRELHDSGNLTRFLLPLRAYSGTGVEDPWIEFHIPGGTDVSAVPASIVMRITCHWLLTLATEETVSKTLRSLGSDILLSEREFSFRMLTDQASGGGSSVAAVIPRTDDPEDDLVVYEEKAHQATVDWILDLNKRR